MKAQCAILLSVTILVAGIIQVANPPAGATTAPTIVKAVMGDENGNDHADHVTLTFSGPVTHVDDKDGSYPFSVASYAITEVGAAKSATTLVITLREKSTKDIEARPKIVYTQTPHQPVTASGKQVAAQTFNQTTPLDADGDGYTVADGDCAPTNPAIHPGAVDLPDLQFVDSNCDGIDGDAAQAIFVAPSGSDSNPGTEAAPKATIQSAITAAATHTPPFNVYAGIGLYIGTISLADHVSIYGNYDYPVSWGARTVDTSTISGAPAATANGVTGVTLQLLTLHGTAGSDGSSYGLFATNDAAVTLDDVTIDADAGVNGANGSPGAPGGAGINGTNASGSSGAGSGTEPAATAPCWPTARRVRTERTRTPAAQAARGAAAEPPGTSPGATAAAGAPAWAACQVSRTRLPTPMPGTTPVTAASVPLAIRARKAAEVAEVAAYRPARTRPATPSAAGAAARAAGADSVAAAEAVGLVAADRSGSTPMRRR